MPQRRLSARRAPAEAITLEMGGEYDSLQKEQRRLAIVVPVSLVIILALLFTAFNSFRDAGLVMAMLPFGLIGGEMSLLITGTPFSISFNRGSGLGDRGVHARRSGDALRHSPRSNMRLRSRRGEATGSMGSAAGDDGLRRGGIGAAPRSGFDRHRSAGTATAGPRGGRRDGDFAPGHSVLLPIPRRACSRGSQESPSRPQS